MEKYEFSKMLDLEPLKNLTDSDLPVTPNNCSKSASSASKKNFLQSVWQNDKFLNISLLEFFFTICNGRHFTEKDMDSFISFWIRL